MRMPHATMQVCACTRHDAGMRMHMPHDPMQVSRRIHAAAFTGGADRQRVVALYKEYVGRLADALASALGSVGAGETGPRRSLSLKAAEEAEEEALLAPVYGNASPTQLSLSPLDPLRYADGQLVVLCDQHDERRVMPSRKKFN